MDNNNIGRIDAIEAEIVNITKKLNENFDSYSSPRHEITEEKMNEVSKKLVIVWNYLSSELVELKR